MINGFASVVPMKSFAGLIPAFPFMFHPLLATMVCQSGTDGVPMFTINWFLTESYTSKPLAGLLMEVIEAVLILGMSIPFAGLDISIWADASGTVVPTPTP